MTPAKKQTPTTKQEETSVTDENTTPETPETTEEITAETVEQPNPETEGAVTPEQPPADETPEETDTITDESTEVAAFRAAAEFFKALDFEYETTFDVHIDKSGIRAFVRHPQNGMRKAEFIPFAEIPAVTRQGIVDQINTTEDGE